MHIAGVLVQTRPEQLAPLQTTLRAMAGLEVHAAHPDGRVVVTVEGDDRRQVADALARLHTLDGVLSACLVYEQSETDFDNAEVP